MANSSIAAIIVVVVVKRYIHIEGEQLTLRLVLPGLSADAVREPPASAAHGEVEHEVEGWPKDEMAQNGNSGRKLTSIKRCVRAALGPRIAHADDRAASAVDGGPREPRAGPEALLLGAGGEVQGVADAGVDVEAHEGGGPLERVRVEGAVERRVAGGEPAKEGVGERRERSVVQGGADEIDALGGVGRAVATGLHDLGGGLRARAREVVSGRLTSISPLSGQGP